MEYRGCRPIGQQRWGRYGDHINGDGDKILQAVGMGTITMGMVEDRDKIYPRAALYCTSVHYKHMIRASDKEDPSSY